MCRPAAAHASVASSASASAQRELTLGRLEWESSAAALSAAREQLAAASGAHPCSCSC